MDKTREKFKKLDGDCWYLKDRNITDFRSEDRLYYQPFDGCSVNINLNYRSFRGNEAEVSINLRQHDSNDNPYLLYWYKTVHVKEVWKTAKTVLSLISSYSYVYGEIGKLDLVAFSLAIKGIGFRADYEDVFYNGKRCNFDSDGEL